MAIPLFESCCYCVPLRTGTLVLGYLNLIGSLFGIIVSTNIAIQGAIFLSGSTDFDESLGNLDEETRNAISREEALKVVGAFILAIGIILLILFSFKLIFVIVLLIGGHRGKPGHIKAYLVFSIVMLVIVFILNILTLITAPSPTGVSQFISYVLEVYFMLVIRSYMIKLRDNPEGDRAGEVDKS